MPSSSKWWHSSKRGQRSPRIRWTRIRGHLCLRKRVRLQVMRTSRDSNRERRESSTWNRPRNQRRWTTLRFWLQEVTQWWRRIRRKWLRGKYRSEMMLNSCKTKTWSQAWIKKMRIVDNLLAVREAVQGWLSSCRVRRVCKLHKLLRINQVHWNSATKICWGSSNFISDSKSSMRIGTSLVQEGQKG